MDIKDDDDDADVCFCHLDTKTMIPFPRCPFLC